MKLRSQEGIGLIEVIVAMLIFGIGITAAMRTLPQSNRATTRSRNLTTATNLAQEKIEELMGSRFNDPDMAAGNHVDTLNPLNTIFTREWTVTDSTPVPDMKRVDVTVTYMSGDNDNSATLTTYITSRR